MSLPTVELDAESVRQSIEEALARFPEFAPYGARLIGRPMYQGVAYQLEWTTAPPSELTNAWEFQNAAAKAYQRRMEGRPGR